MKAFFAIGVIILILGILSFFVPVPHTEHHGLDAGDSTSASKATTASFCRPMWAWS